MNANPVQGPSRWHPDARAWPVGVAVVVRAAAPCPAVAHVVAVGLECPEVAPEAGPEVAEGRGATVALGHAVAVPGHGDPGPALVHAPEADPVLGQGLVRGQGLALVHGPGLVHGQCPGQGLAVVHAADLALEVSVAAGVVRGLEALAVAVEVAVDPDPGPHLQCAQRIASNPIPRTRALQPRSE